MTINFIAYIGFWFVCASVSVPAAVAHRVGTFVIEYHFFEVELNRTRNR